MTTLAGSSVSGTGSANGVGVLAEFNAPQAVAVDGYENIFVADTSNNLIKQITSQGIYISHPLPRPLPFLVVISS